MKGDLFVDVFFFCFVLFFPKMQFIQVGSLGTRSGGGEGKTVVLQGDYAVGGSGVRKVQF